MNLRRKVNQPIKIQKKLWWRQDKARYFFFIQSNAQECDRPITLFEEKTIINQPIRIIDNITVAVRNARGTELYIVTRVFVFLYKDCTKISYQRIQGSCMLLLLQSTKIPRLEHRSSWSQYQIPWISSRGLEEKYTRVSMWEIHRVFRTLNKNQAI